MRRRRRARGFRVGDPGALKTQRALAIGQLPSLATGGVLAAVVAMPAAPPSASRLCVACKTRSQAQRGAVETNVLVQQIVGRYLQQQGISFQKFLTYPGIPENYIGIKIKCTGFLPEIGVHICMYLEFLWKEHVNVRLYAVCPVICFYAALHGRSAFSIGNRCLQSQFVFFIF